MTLKAGQKRKGEQVFPKELIETAVDPNVPPDEAHVKNEKGELVAKIVGIDWSMDGNDRTMISGPLIKEGTDSMGDHFSAEVLKEMVDKAKPVIEHGDMYAYEGFKREKKHVQGRVLALTTQEEKPQAFSVGCVVEMLDTPAAERIKKVADGGIEVEPAVMGRGTPEVVDGVRIYKGVTLDGVALIPAKDKVR
jgi:hypothetical protein